MILPFKSDIKTVDLSNGKRHFVLIFKRNSFVKGRISSTVRFVFTLVTAEVTQKKMEPRLLKDG